MTKKEKLIGKKIGVQLGSTYEKTAQEIKDVKLVSLNKSAEIIQEIKTNRIQAGIFSDTVAKGFIANNPDLEFHTLPTTEEEGSAIAFPKGSQRVADFNRVLKEMKESGEIERLEKNGLKIVQQL